MNIQNSKKTLTTHESTKYIIQKFSQYREVQISYTIIQHPSLIFILLFTRS